MRTYLPVPQLDNFKSTNTLSYSFLIIKGRVGVLVNARGRVLTAHWVYILLGQGLQVGLCPTLRCLNIQQGDVAALRAVVQFLLLLIELV